jgi:hypothetical protein
LRSLWPARRPCRPRPWGGIAIQVVPWTIIDSADTAAEFAAQLSRQPLRHISFTSISNALAFAREFIRSNEYMGLRRVIDVSGDGPNNAGAPVPVVRNAATAEGIAIDGLPIMLSAEVLRHTRPGRVL